MRISVVVPWVESPLRHFVEEARVQLAVLLHPSGQVLGQYGFARSVDVMSACALASAIHASSSELGRQVEGKPFTGMHYAGTQRQMYLAPVPLGTGSLLLFAVFDEGSSLGLVQVFFREFCALIEQAAPTVTDAAPALATDFESELNRNLAKMFGRA